MSIFKKRKPTIAEFWASRYLIALTIGICTIGIIMVLWIRHTTVEHRLSFAHFIAEDTASRIISNFNINQTDFSKETTNRNYESTNLQPHLYIVNQFGEVIASNVSKDKMLFTSINLILLDSKDSFTTVKHAASSENYYLIDKEIIVGSQNIGWVLVLDKESNFKQIDNEYSKLIIALIVVGLIGWLVIYFLSRRLAKPIVEVTNAAKKIEQGNYEVVLRDDVKEQEIFDLVYSFTEMSQRLNKLEKVRTELLAGVTHELKTPIASISGLLQAINDDIVTEEEAKEFIRLSLKESIKMKTMVEDLLSFNSYVSNVLPISLEVHELEELVRTTINEWKLLKGNEDITIQLLTNGNDVLVEVDYIRFNQILINLLNNALQAMDAKKAIKINILQQNNYIYIDVKDCGKGIPLEEQNYIFERFYRGENKKYATRGLGLGLPLSKMLAQNMKGDLYLKESSSQGTTFTISLPIYKE